MASFHMFLRRIDKLLRFHPERTQTDKQRAKTKRQLFGKKGFESRMEVVTNSFNHRSFFIEEQNGMNFPANVA